MMLMVCSAKKMPKKNSHLNIIQMAVFKYYYSLFFSDPLQLK